MFTTTNSTKKTAKNCYANLTSRYYNRMITIEKRFKTKETKGTCLPNFYYFNFFSTVGTIQE